MNDEQYQAINNQYRQIEESCYRMGIEVDTYYKLIAKQGETVEEHLNRISELEKICDEGWSD